MTWPSPSTMKMPSRMTPSPPNPRIYSTNRGPVSGIYVWTLGAIPCHGVDQIWSDSCRGARNVEITPRIFVRRFGHRLCYFSPHDPSAALLVPRAFRRLSPRKRVARTPPLPGRSHLLPRRNNRPGRLRPRQALGAGSRRVPGRRQRAPHPRRVDGRGTLRHAGVLAPAGPDRAAHVRGLRPHERLSAPRASLGRLHRVPLPLRRVPVVPGSLPGLDLLPAGGLLLRRAPRRGRRALPAVGL